MLQFSIAILYLIQLIKANMIYNMSKRFLKKVGWEIPIGQFAFNINLSMKSCICE